MVEIILTVIMFIAGAVSEYESKGQVTRAIQYQDGNATITECN